MEEKEQLVTFRPLRRQDGSSEFEDFYNSLPRKDRLKLFTVIDRVEEHGLLVSRSQKWVKKLNNDLYELRAKVGSNIQRALDFQKQGDEYLITHGFTKKTDKTPRLEIKHAENYES